MPNFVYFLLFYFIKTLQNVFFYTPLMSCGSILYPNIVIIEEFVKIYFCDCLLSWLQTASYRNRYFYLSILHNHVFIYIILKRACLSKNCNLSNDRLKQDQGLKRVKM